MTFIRHNGGMTKHRTKPALTFAVEVAGRDNGYNQKMVMKILAKAGCALVGRTQIGYRHEPKARLTFSVAAAPVKRVTDKRHTTISVESLGDVRKMLLAEKLPPPIPCTNCKQLFLSRRRDAVTCSPKCRTALYRKRNG